MKVWDFFVESVRLNSFHSWEIFLRGKKKTIPILLMWHLLLAPFSFSIKICTSQLPFGSRRSVCCSASIIGSLFRWKCSLKIPSLLSSAFLMVLIRKCKDIVLTALYNCCYFYYDLDTFGFLDHVSAVHVHSDSDFRFRPQEPSLQCTLWFQWSK